MAPLTVLTIVAVIVVLIGVVVLIWMLIRFRRKMRVLRRSAEEKPVAGVKASRPELRQMPRKSLRINISVTKRLTGDNVKLVELKSVNLSESGILLASDDLSLFSVDEKLELTAAYKRKKYDLGTAKVVRKQETFVGATKRRVRSGFGLTFVDTSPAQHRHIMALLG